jgi:hypothetical protein
MQRKFFSQKLTKNYCQHGYSPSSWIVEKFRRGRTIQKVDQPLNHQVLATPVDGYIAKVVYSCGNKVI